MCGVLVRSILRVTILPLSERPRFVQRKLTIIGPGHDKTRYSRCTRLSSIPVANPGKLPPTRQSGAYHPRFCTSSCIFTPIAHAVLLPQYMYLWRNSRSPQRRRSMPRVELRLSGGSI
jgi:hypothetical protein